MLLTKAETEQLLSVVVSEAVGQQVLVSLIPGWHECHDQLGDCWAELRSLWCLISVSWARLWREQPFCLII